jgi:hypothetical protein
MVEEEEEQKEEAEETYSLQLNIIVEGLVLPKFQICDFFSCDKYIKNVDLNISVG